MNENTAGIVIAALLERLPVLSNLDVKLRNSAEVTSWVEAAYRSRKDTVNVPSTVIDDIQSALCAFIIKTSLFNIIKRANNIIKNP